MAGVKNHRERHLATKPRPPIIDADFDETMSAMLSVKPSPGKKTKTARKKTARPASTQTDH